MTYLLEKLGEDRFQQLCQALIGKSYPKTQFFPIRQPDGGRDALVYSTSGDRNEIRVFQVKFVRNPQQVADVHTWLLQIVRAEVPKVRQLVSRGATEYFLLTNVSGTGHLDVGSIDKMNALLSGELGISAYCWWRDDIERKLDSASDVKWSYPEILAGTDVLQLIVENGLTESKQRRTNAIRAFVRRQYERDREVRFKQIELQNRLLDLFIDVPVSLRDISGRPQRGFSLGHDSIYAAVYAARGAHNAPYEAGRSMGAAALLLHPSVQANADRVVLEGAPGQGKSTIVQFVCQIHRRQILGETGQAQDIAEGHQNKPIRLPFKVDLRDLALWLDGRDPFNVSEAADKPDGWHKSLEAFLAATVRYESGGVEFSVDDLHAVARVSAVLLVCDGLDEVADIGARQSVVTEITKAVQRLSQNALSLQTIVTSRPAAFANSPGMSEKEFIYIELGSITRPLIEAYAQKWLKARNLHGREAADVNRILRDKLDQPHLREIARNPMQLSIVLSLINRFGESLPEKRTALYDSYVTLFLSREAEKSLIVREHGDLIIDIHQFLAWRLHSEAQTHNTGGRISDTALRELVTGYLRDEGHDTTIVDELFSGVVDRVMALVSRVEGTFEFEVQPLREYFAARHLYRSAPYAPQGIDSGGTKPDRFEALAKDFYWLNVARFYAGCYDKGEFSSLIDSLEELAKEDLYQHTSHPQELAAILLADWVFASSPKAMQRVVSLTIDGLGLRRIASSRGRRPNDEMFVLPKKCGNEQLLQRCFDILQTSPPVDFSRLIIELVNSNADKSDKSDRWLAAVTSSIGQERTRWLQYGIQMGELGTIKADQLTSIMSDAPFDPDRLQYLIRSGRGNYLESDQQRFSHSVDCVLARPHHSTGRKSLSSLDALSNAVNARRYSFAFADRVPMPLSEVLRRRGYGHADDDEEAIGWPVSDLGKMVEDLVVSADEALKVDSAVWASSLEPWKAVVDKGRQIFGERWAFYELANCSAHIKSRVERGQDAPDLFDKSVSLCERMRYARLQTNSTAWWKSHFERAADELDRLLAAMSFFSWAAPKSLQRLSDNACELIDPISDDHWKLLCDAIRLASELPEADRSKTEVNLDTLSDNVSDRVIALIGVRAEPASCDALCEKYLKEYRGSDTLILSLLQRNAVRRAFTDVDRWVDSLDIIKASYDHGVISDPYWSYRFVRGIEGDKIPLQIARKIVEDADHFPTEFVSLADQACRREAAAHVIPVGKVAEREKWVGR